MNNPWLTVFPFNQASKLYPPLAPVLIPPFLTQPANSFPFNYSLSTSSNGSSSSTASSPFSLPSQIKTSPEKVTSNENLFPSNKQLSAKSQLFLIERLFPQLAAAINESKPVESPKECPSQITPINSV
jgi:hypothetical protein